MNKMTATYLGTAAAEGLPAVFCNCNTCLEARRKGGKNIRTRSQILINDDLLLDFPMDTYMHALTNRLDLSAVRHVFITHAHMDHCYPQDLTMHGEPYAHNMTAQTIHIYGNATVLEVFAEQTRRELKPSVAPSVVLHELKPYDVTETDGYAVTALPAQHTAGENCLVYLIAYNGTRFLHLNDTGILPDTVYDFLGEHSGRIDTVSFDCTYGYFKKGPGRHMGVLDAVGERDKLIGRGLTDEDTRYVLTHFSHNGALDHTALVRKVKPLGFKVAYDGMKIIV